MFDFTSPFLVPVTICCMVADFIGVEGPLLNITEKEPC